jgi:hypothetical protein
MLQSTLLKRISSSKFKTSLFHIRVDRLYPHPILHFTYSPINCIQSLGIKLPSLKGYWLKVILTFSNGLVLRTLIQILTVTFWQRRYHLSLIISERILTPTCLLHLYFFYYDGLLSFPMVVNSIPTGLGDRYLAWLGIHKAGGNAE